MKNITIDYANYKFENIITQPASVKKRLYDVFYPFRQTEFVGILTD